MQVMIPTSKLNSPVSASAVALEAVDPAMLTQWGWVCPVDRLSQHMAALRLRSQALPATVLECDPVCLQVLVESSLLAALLAVLAA